MHQPCKLRNITVLPWQIGTKWPVVGALGGSSYPIPQKKSLSKVLFQFFKKGKHVTGDQMSEKEFIT